MALTPLSTAKHNDHVVNGTATPTVNKGGSHEKNSLVHRGNLTNLKIPSQHILSHLKGQQTRPHTLNLKAGQQRISLQQNRNLVSLNAKKIESQLNLVQKQAEVIAPEAEKLSSFATEVRSWETIYLKWMDNLKDYGNLQRKVLESLKYFYINRENFLTSIRNFLSEEQHDYMEAQLDQGREASKIVSSVAHILFNAIKWCLVKLESRHFIALERRWKILKNEIPDHQRTNLYALEIKSIQEQMDNLRSKLKHDQQTAQDQGFHYSVKLGVKGSALLLTKILIRWKTLQEIAGDRLQTVAHKMGSKSSKYTACIFKYLIQIHEIYLALCLQKTWMQELKLPLIKMNADGSIEAPDVKALLHKRQLEFQENVNKSLPEIKNHIEHCQNLTFDETQQYFANLHIHLAALEDPPKNEEEWTNKIQLEEFHVALATEWIKHQETVAKLQEQVLRQALLSKNSMERSLLCFRCVENVASIFSSLIQIILVIPFFSTYAMLPFLKKLTTDLSKDKIPLTNIRIPHLGLTYLMFPEINLRVLDLFAIFIFEYIVGVIYKPHEYSFAGYKLSIQIKLLRMYLPICTLMAGFEQALLWINVQVVENCVLRLDRKPSEDPRMVRINEDLVQQRLNCKRRIKDLEACLNQLRIKDTRASAFSQKDPLNPDIDPFEILAKTAEELNLDYFPESTCQLFEKHLGIHVTKLTATKMKKSLEDAFLPTEEAFVESYHSRHSKIRKL